MKTILKGLAALGIGAIMAGSAFAQEEEHAAGGTPHYPLNKPVEQDWSFEGEINKNVGAWGSQQVRLVYRDVSDYVDVIPIGTGQSIGNIDKTWAAAIVSTAAVACSSDDDGSDSTGGAATGATTTTTSATTTATGATTVPSTAIRMVTTSATAAITSSTNGAETSTARRNSCR